MFGAGVGLEWVGRLNARRLQVLDPEEGGDTTTAAAARQHRAAAAGEQEGQTAAATTAAALPGLPATRRLPGLLRRAARAQPAARFA